MSGRFDQRDPEELRAIGSKGGKGSHGCQGQGLGKDSAQYEAGLGENTWENRIDPTGGGGGSNHGGSKNTNPGNFANRPKEELSEIGRRGGQIGGLGGKTETSSDPPEDPVEGNDAEEFVPAEDPESERPLAF